MREYRSETDKARDTLLPYCVGYGLDLGFGGDKISSSSIGVDMPNPYAKTGDDVVQLGGDARDLYWFKDKVLDYVYSSHLLEDFEDKKAVLKEWTRVLKLGGFIVLYLPDEQIYRKYCEKSGQPYNQHHKDVNFSKDTIKKIAKELGNLEIVFESQDVIVDYSFAIVLKKTL